MSSETTPDSLAPHVHGLNGIHGPAVLDINEKRDSVDPDAAINEVIFPDDSYVNGVYWADLPFGQRASWIIAQNNTETAREFRAFWTMFKNDPLAPIGFYFQRYVVPGLGLFTEGYTIFSIGNLNSLFSSVWHTCWATYVVCNKTWVAAVTYLEICGIICGQIMVGIEADYVGRRFGGLQDAIVMLLGTLGLAASWGKTLNGWVICYAWMLFFYSVGVGGEYPITGTRTIELPNSGVAAQRNDKLHRGRNLVLSFLMQGWGQLLNQAILVILLLIFHGGGNPPYTEVSTQWTFRLSFICIAIVNLYMLYQRYFKARSVDKVVNRAKKRTSVSGYDAQSLRLIGTHYGGRLLATAGSWFASDVFFYGSKLFQSSFLKVINPHATVLDNWLWNILNIGVSLCGYYLAAFLVDHKLYGRVNMQCVGFVCMFITFVIPTFDYGPIQTPGGIHAFQALYYLGSFFTQFGPNCTTFLAAAECYPASIRGTAHGVSAASGKLGALIPAILYNYVDSHTRFYFVTWFGILGFVLTVVFLPDMTGLDLREQERYWAFVKAGRASEYHGVAVHPRHLSFWEHRILKRSKAYNPELDKQAKIAELRAAYESFKAREVHMGYDKEAEIEDDDSFISSGVSSFFEREKDNGDSRYATFHQ